MRILLISRDSMDLWKLEYIRDYVKQRIPEITIDIICGERDTDKFSSGKNIHYIFDGYDTWSRQHENTPNREITALHAEQYKWVPSNLYKSDERYVRNTPPPPHLERRLALQQAYLVDKAHQFLEDSRPDYVFMTGGGSLIRNVFFFLAEKMHIRAYRIMNRTYLNPNRQGLRYWFGSSTYDRISATAEDKFDYDSVDVAQHVEALIDSIRHTSYKLDTYARTKGRPTRFSLNKWQLLQDARQVTSLRRLRIVPRGRSWNRLQTAKNYYQNKQLATSPTDLPDPFFLFPLNMPGDAQLVLRAPHLQDLFSICEQVANVLPYGVSLVIKEHPGHPGMLNHNRLKSMLRHFPNICFVEGDIRLTDILPKTTALVTINSTAALEALSQNIPVVTLGETYYKNTGLTYDVDYMLQLQHVLTEVLADPKKVDRQECLIATLRDLLQETVPAPNIIEPNENENFLNLISQGIVSKLERLI
jgi:hypothetical protein